MKKIVTRVEARALGLPRYYTGKACINNHQSERYTVSCECISCNIERTLRRQQRLRVLQGTNRKIEGLDLKKIVTLAEARALGLPRYYTGKPCINNHQRERYTVSGECISCNTERTLRRQQRLRVLQCSGTAQEDVL